MNAFGWEPVSGQLWWPWPLDGPGARALLREFADRSLLGAFAAGNPAAGQTVVEFLLARDPSGRVAVLDPEGAAVAGPDYRMLAQSLSLAAGGAVDIDGFEYEAPAADAALELDPSEGGTALDSVEVAEPPVLRTVMVGRFRREDLLMFGALNSAPLDVFEDDGERGRRIVVVHGGASPGLYNWPEQAKPMAAFMNLDGLRAVEAWLPGTRKDPANNFWHAWQPQPKPFPSTDRASAEALRLLGTLIRSADPHTGELARAFGLDRQAEARLSGLLLGEESEDVLAQTAEALGLPRLAGELAESGQSARAVPEHMPALPLGKAVLELMATPMTGSSPLARWHRRILAHPELLAGSAAVAAGAAVVLLRASGRPLRRNGGLLRAGALSLAAEAASELALYGYLKFRRR
jgi:hypothetical protein